MNNLINDKIDNLENNPTIIVIGNEKGGSGKSTTAMHIIAGLLVSGYKVAAIDLDARQATLSNYIENRKNNSSSMMIDIKMPEHIAILSSDLNNLEDAKAIDADNLAQAIAKFSQNNDFLVIDTPGSDSNLSREGHSYADILVTPLNDSFVDFDILAKVDLQSYKIKSPSHYAQMVFEQKIKKAKRSGVNRTFDWIVIRNRMGQLTSRNQKAINKAILELSKRIGFRIAAGFSERVIFKELFLQGLTLFDINQKNSPIKLNMSHVAARQEMRNLLIALKLPIKVI